MKTPNQKRDNSKRRLSEVDLRKFTLIASSLERMPEWKRDRIVRALSAMYRQGTDE